MRVHAFSAGGWVQESDVHPRGDTHHAVGVIPAEIVFAVARARQEPRGAGNIAPPAAAAETSIADKAVVDQARAVDGLQAFAAQRANFFSDWPIRRPSCLFFNGLEVVAAFFCQLADNALGSVFSTAAVAQW